MLISTAILRGSKGRYQIRGGLTDGKGGVCALGAACYGVGKRPADSGKGYETIPSWFPKLKTRPNSKDIVTRIWTLNDRDRRSFKYIVNWLKRKRL